MLPSLQSSGNWIDTSEGVAYNAQYMGTVSLTNRFGGGFFTPGSQISQWIKLPFEALQALSSGTVLTISSWFEITAACDTDQYMWSMASIVNDNHFIVSCFGGNLNVYPTDSRNFPTSARCLTQIQMDCIFKTI